MDPGTAIASAWSSGISMYGVAALLGIAGRLDRVDSPAWLQEWWVIGVATALFALEFVIDKIAAVDSTWDAVHTFLRPAAGAVLMGGADLEASTALLGLGGGTLAFTAHAAKATLRGLVNTSPEPVSNVVVSLGEDGLVAALMAVALANPEVALVITLVLAVASVVVTVVLFRFLRRLLRRMCGSRTRSSSPSYPSDP